MITPDEIERQINELSSPPPPSLTTPTPQAPAEQRMKELEDALRKADEIVRTGEPSDERTQQALQDSYALTKAIDDLKKKETARHPLVDFALNFGRHAFVDAPAAMATLPRTAADAAQQIPGAVSKATIDWLVKNFGDSFASPEMQRQWATEGAQQYDKPLRMPITGQPLGGPSFNDVTGGIDQVTGNRLAVEPEGGAGKFGELFGDFATPTALLGGGTPMQRALRVGTEALPGAIGAQALTSLPGVEGTAWEPFMLLAGGLIGSGVGALGTRAVTSRSQQLIASQIANEMTLDEVNRAREIFARGQRIGQPVTWPEAIAASTEGRVNMSRLQRWVEQSQGGEQTMRNVINERTRNLEGSFDNALTAALGPGGAQNPYVTATAVKDAGKAAINRVRNLINDSAKPYYDRLRGPNAPMISEDAYRELVKDPIIREAIQRLRNPTSIEMEAMGRDVRGYPNRSVTFLNQVVKVIRDDIEYEKVVMQGTTREAGRLRPGAVANIQREASAVSPDYVTARQIGEAGRRAVLSPLEAQLDDIVNGRASLTRLLKSELFSKNPPEGSEFAAGLAVQRLAAEDLDAATRLVRSYLRSVFNETTRSATGVREFAGAAIFRKLMGNQQQARNLEAMIRALPQGDVRWAALNDFMQGVQTQGWRMYPGSPTEFNRIITEYLAEGGTALTEAGAKALSPGKWLTAIDDYAAKIRLGQASRELADIFTDPASGELFERMVREGYNPQQAYWRIMIAITAPTLAGQQKEEVDGR